MFSGSNTEFLRVYTNSKKDEWNLLKQIKKNSYMPGVEVLMNTNDEFEEYDPAWDFEFFTDVLIRVERMS